MIDPRDVFPAYAVQSVAKGGSSQGLGELWSDYWSLQMHLANLTGNYSSDLQDLQDPRFRSCGICGLVHGTDEYGSIPSNCENAECRLLREFWRYGGSDSLVRPCRASGFHNRTPGSVASARSTWFKKYMTETFSTTNLFDLPPELRLQTLMGMTIARMAIEQRGEVDKRVSIATPRDAKGDESQDDHTRTSKGHCGTGATTQRQHVHCV